MSTYFVKGKGWRFDFTHKGARETGTWFKTKQEARKKEAERKEEIVNPKPLPQIPIDMAFLELVNKRLDYVKAYHSAGYYRDTCYLAKKWIEEWNGYNCSDISDDMVQDFMLKRSKVSGYTANKDLRYLRIFFNFGIQKRWISINPTAGIAFFPTILSVTNNCRNRCSNNT